MRWKKKCIDTLIATKNQSKTGNLLRLSFSQIHTVMERAVERGMARRDKTLEYKHLGIDEKSVGRGHTYLSIISDEDTGTVIDCVAGRKSADINSLIENIFTQEQREAVETVCTDMWDPFIKAATKYFTNASHCHDMYHCVSYLNEAVDKVRRWETKSQPKLKGTRYIWLKDISKFTDRQQKLYDELMQHSLRVADAWVIKEQFRRLIQEDYSGDRDAYAFFESWFEDALATKLSAIENVAYMFKRHLKGIIRAWVNKTSNGKAERLNGSIQEIRTIGRGYATPERFRIAILFFHGNLDLYPHRFS